MAGLPATLQYDEDGNAWMLIPIRAEDAETLGHARLEAMFYQAVTTAINQVSIRRRFAISGAMRQPDGFHYEVAFNGAGVAI
jgi:hypothetical protein